MSYTTQIAGLWCCHRRIERRVHAWQIPWKKITFVPRNAELVAAVRDVILELAVHEGVVEQAALGQRAQLQDVHVLQSREHGQLRRLQLRQRRQVHVHRVQQVDGRQKRVHPRESITFTS